MKNSGDLLFKPAPLVCFICLILIVMSCNKSEYEVENHSIIGNMGNQQTAFNVLSATSQGMPLSAEITVSGSGVLNIIGAITMSSTFDFDFTTGMGSNFNTTYTDKDGNTFILVGSSQAVLGQEFGIYVTENAVSGEGRFKKITTASGGTSGITMDQMTGQGFGRIEWLMTF